MKKWGRSGNNKRQYWEGKRKKGEVKKMRSQEQLGGWMDWPRDLPHITGETWLAIWNHVTKWITLGRSMMAPCELQQNSYTCDVGYKWLTQTGGEWHSGDEKKCATFPGDRWHCREQQGAAMALCAVRALNACIYCCLIGPKCLCECVCVGVRQRVGGRGDVKKMQISLAHFYIAKNFSFG